MRNLVYYVAASIDGYISDRNGDFSVFPQHPDTLRELFARYPETCPVHAREALGVTGEARRFDAVIMGRRTYQPALDMGLSNGAYPHVTQYVVTPPAGLVLGPAGRSGPGWFHCGSQAAAGQGHLALRRWLQVCQQFGITVKKTRHRRS